MRFSIDGLMELHGMEFHAYHGCLESERRDGNLFVVDFEGALDIQKAAASDDLRDTVDTRAIYAIVKREMEKPRNLLETVAASILSGILEEYYDDFIFAKVTVAKHNPPFDGKCEWSKVTASFNI